MLSVVQTLSAHALRRIYNLRHRLTDLVIKQTNLASFTEPREAYQS